MASASAGVVTDDPADRQPSLPSAWSPGHLGPRASLDSDWWRLRVGDLRLVYAIEDGRRLVIILLAARRNESTYRRG